MELESESYSWPSESNGVGLRGLLSWILLVMELKFKSYGVGVQELWSWVLRVMELEVRELWSWTLKVMELESESYGIGI